MIFSIAIYALKFERENGSSQLAVDTLKNFGNSLTEKPIVEIKLLKKFKSAGELNTCADVKGSSTKDKGNFVEHSYGTFAEIS